MRNPLTNAEEKAELMALVRKTIWKEVGSALHFGNVIDEDSLMLTAARTAYFYIAEGEDNSLTETTPKTAVRMLEDEIGRNHVEVLVKDPDGCKVRLRHRDWWLCNGFFQIWPGSRPRVCLHVGIGDDRIRTNQPHYCFEATMMVDRTLPVIDELSDELMLIAKEEAEKKTRQVGEKMARKTRKESKVQLPDNTENHRLSVIDISEKDEIDKAVSNLISKYTEESKSEFYGIPQRKHVETELVMNMFCDILESRHLASTEGKQAFTGDDLIDALKEYGVGKVDIKQGKWERDLILPNGKYYVENEKYGNSLMAATHETEFWHYRKSIRVTGLTAKETARYIVEFDTLIPDLLQALDKRYGEIDDIKQKTDAMKERIHNSVRSALDGSGFDYDCYIDSHGKINLIIERIVYTRKKVKLTESKLSAFLNNIKEIMEKTKPHVSQGVNIRWELFERYRNEMYDKLTRDHASHIRFTKKRNRR